MSRAFALLLLASAGCDGRPIELSVDVRTDLVADTDFHDVRVELMPGQGGDIAPVSRRARASDPWAAGVRVAEFTGVPAGAARVRAVLLDAAGSEVLAREVDLALTSSYAVTIVLTADCIGRTCPGVSEPLSFNQCLHGECVDPRCGGSTPEGCGRLACENAGDCAGVLTCVSACVGGACTCTAPELDAGPRSDGGPPDVDGGPCPGECVAGETSEETQPCGNCGEGVQRRTRTCGSNCTWGAFGTFGACETGATCAPGQTDSETRGCGNCNLGSQSRMRGCDAATCTWGAWSGYTTCSGGGACSPGDTRAGGCDSCSHQVCSASCTWGSCRLRSGNQCDWEGGSNWRCCGSNSWQFCLSSCQWSTACAGGCGCGC